MRESDVWPAVSVSAPTIRLQHQLRAMIGPHTTRLQATLVSTWER